MENYFEPGLFLPLLILGVLTHLIRTTYEILKHRKLLIPNSFTFVVMFLNMTLLWISWFALCIISMDRAEVPFAIRLIGLIIVAAGVVVFLTALFTIKTLESYEGDLITTGIYSKLRHPMYLGFILLLTGLPVFTESPYLLILSVLFSANILYWRSLEENELDRRFPGYKSYKCSTLF
jgi:protein-S-isoprenylcysteine O-methyltransferase Ste14